MALSAAESGEEGAGHDRGHGGGGGGVSGGRAAATCGGRGRRQCQLAMGKTEEARVVRAGGGHGSLADWVVCAGCRRGRE